LSPEEATGLARVREGALAQTPDRVALEQAAPSLRFAEAHVFERVSVARDHHLFTEALRHGRGRIAMAELRGTFELAEASGAVVRAGHDVATRESVDRERRMIAAINAGVGKFDRLGRAQGFVASDRLRPEQRHAVDVVLASHDLAVNIRGAAGTGKTALLEELSRGLRENGREVVAVAPTRSAVDELHHVGFSTAMTIQQLLEGPARDDGLRGAVLIVDEGGMVSGRQMHALLRLAHEQGARVVFSGDTRQLQSVEASDALRILERESWLHTVLLTQVQRQTAKAYREAIKTLRDDPARGFARLEQMGAVLEVAWTDRAQTVAEAWRQARTQMNAHGQQSSVLVVCATHAEIGRVTEAIRTERRHAGELGEGVRLERYAPVHYTMAQKRDLRAIQPGHVLLFHKGVRDIARHEALDVVQVERQRLMARTAGGETRVVTDEHAHAFDVYERQPIDIAPNDRVLLMANRREAGFRATNGELVTVSRIEEDGRLALTDGRTLPATYKQFDHGYAVTAHRSQGKTVDAVVIAGETLSRELFYVAASRGRERLTVVTSDKALLQESIGYSGARQSASELVRAMAADVERGQQPGLARGVDRGLGGAVGLARQVSYEWEPEPSQAVRPSFQHVEDTMNRDEGASPQQKRGHGYGLS
jgi:ATP-dependent exoDNAse (exonuclease V) alpha subunit